MRILVTGGTGFIGRHLVPRLLAARHEVTALVRPTSRTDRLPAGVRLATGDVTDRPSVARALEGCDAVVHAAALVRLGRIRPEVIRAANVEGTRNVLEAALDAGVARALHISSIAAIGVTDGLVADETAAHGGLFKSEYERTKHEGAAVADDLARRGLPVVQALPSVVFGARDPNFGVVFKLVARGHIRRIPAPETVLSFVHVEELADGLRLAFERGRPGERYLLTQANLTLAEFFEHLATGMGRPPPTGSWSTATLRRLARPLAALAALTPLRENVSAEPFAVLGRTMAYTSAKAMRDLGWKPGDVGACLRETAAFYAERERGRRTRRRNPARGSAGWNGAQKVLPPTPLPPR